VSLFLSSLIFFSFVCFFLSHIGAERDDSGRPIRCLIGVTPNSLVAH
jgi:hypothetical protein